MSDSDLCFLSIGQVADLMAAGRLSPVELTEATLRRIERLNPLLNAYLAVPAEMALSEARAAERALRAGERRGPLHGVPIALKDLIDVADMPTTAGMARRRHAVATTDATVTARLRAAGAVIIGKTGLHECAYGVTSANPHYGPVRNPWDTSLVPGGSSGGSGAAVAAGLCGGALGTDTGGSIRIPAAHCGVVGLKPTYGRVSRAGVVPLAWSLDHVGPMTRTVTDAGLLLDAIAGPDRRDPTTAAPTEGATEAVGGLAGRRIGVPRDHFWEALDPAVAQLTEATLRTLEAAGALLEPVALPSMADSLAAQQIISLAEASAYHEADITTRPDAYGLDVRERLLAGLTVRATDYLLAQRVRAALIAEMRAVWTTVELLVTPATAALPTPIDGADAHLLRGPMTRCSAPINLLGLPALALPCGLTAAGQPVGVQLIAPAFAESMLLQAGAALEGALGWGGRRPPLD